MQIVIAGGHGKIALRLEQLLSSRSDTAVGLVRNPEHVDDLAQVGARSKMVDLEQTTPAELAPSLEGAHAVVFAAGAGPGSGAARKDSVDRAAAVLLADAAALAGVRRYLLVSSFGVEQEPDSDADEVMVAYLRAKAAAEQELRTRDLDLTILRPGALTDDAGTGRVTLARSVEYGQISRDDVARTLLALLDEPDSVGLTLELVAGDTDIDQAVAAAVGRG